MREWKELQMGLIGSEVPIVRCLTHERATLNLSFAGRIFESQYLDWENSFASVVDPQNLILARCLTSCAVVKKLVVPKRSAQALPAMIDLSSHYNVMLDESWPSCEPLRPFASMPSGIVEIDKTSFDIRGAVQLGALSPGLVPYPSAVTNIAIGLPGHQVHLLLATVLPARPDTPTAECVFHLADGRCQRQQLRYGAHLATCVGRPGEPVPALHEGKVAWSNALSDGGTAQLYQCGWTNPAPEQRIQSMDFVALDGNAGPLLVAVSVE
jgi:hypothetical protein